MEQETMHLQGLIGMDALAEGDGGDRHLWRAATALALAGAIRAKAGGVIVNEHILGAAQTRRHVETLGRWFEFIHLDELPQRLQRPGNKPFCLLTFDDGKRSNATETAGELARLGVPAVFYLVTGFVGGQTALWTDRYRALRSKLGDAPPGLALEILKRLPYRVVLERIERASAQWGVDADMKDDNIRPMDWDEARALAKRGFSIGAHGVTHAILPWESRAEAVAEIADSVERVSQEIGKPCPSFAFPNGNYTADLARYAISRGVWTVMTTEPRWADNTFPQWRLPRIQLHPEDGPAKMELKLAIAATGMALKNPDGTGRLYRTINKPSAAHGFRQSG